MNIHITICAASQANEINLYDHLSSFEYQRALTISNEIARSTYIKSRAFLRHVLSDELSVDPRNINVERSIYGKPYIPGGPSFNLSHSGSHLAIAICEKEPIGFDIEQLDTKLDFSRLTESCFSTHELRQLNSMTHSNRRSAFFIGWTRKEAILKGLGTGFCIAPSDFDVSLDKSERLPLLKSRTEQLITKKWQLIDIPVFQNAFSAIAVQSCQSIRLFYKTIEF